MSRLGFCSSYFCFVGLFVFFGSFYTRNDNDCPCVTRDHSKRDCKKKAPTQENFLCRKSYGGDKPHPRKS